MDIQQLITWVIMIIAALGLDVAAYILLRLDWKKKGSTLTDRFWNALFDKVDGVFKALKTRIDIALLKYHKAVVEAKPASAPEPAPPPVAPPIEVVPVLVRNVGKVRRIKFFLDMPIDTQVDVHIGATRDAGVTVEKREI